MSDQTVITEEKDKSIGQEVREKSFSQIIHDIQNPVEEKTEEVVEEPTEDEEKKAADAEKAVKEAEEARAKEQADLASKAAEEVLAKQEAAKQAEMDRVKAEDAEKARLESLKPSWQTDPNAPKDENGNPLPRSYDEIAKETARIAEENAVTRIRAEQAEAAAKAKEEADTTAKTQADQAAAIKARDEAFAKELQDEETDLYTKNLMPKIKDPKNPQDPGLVARENLYKKAVEVNAERIAKGEPAIRSIKLIYYEYYKPTQNLAGHDAPVIGNESTISNETPDDKYIPSRDRKKSVTQLLKEAASAQAAKFKVRGN